MKITGTSKALRRSFTASRPELPSASWMSARIRPGRLVGGELHRLGPGAGDADHVMPEPFDQSLEIHGDERLVLDDEDIGGHVGGQFATRLVDEFAHRFGIDVEDAGRPPPRQSLRGRTAGTPGGASGVIWPMRTSAGRSRWICSLRPFTDREFQIRVKTWNRSTLTFPAGPMVSGSLTRVSRSPPHRRRQPSGCRSGRVRSDEDTVSAGRQAELSTFASP